MPPSIRGEGGVIESNHGRGRRRPRALVTGASSGIGRSVALDLASRGHDLVASGRDAGALRALAAAADRLGASTTVVAGDLTTPGAVDRLYDLTANGGAPDVLALCAGAGAFGPLHTTDWPTTAGVLSLNVVATSELIVRLVPWMVSRGAGNVLTIASTSAFFTNADTATYNASKAYLVSLTLSLAQGLRGTGVSATVSCPGPTRTAFVERAGIPEHWRPSRRRTAAPEDVARDSVDAMFARRPLLVHGRLSRTTVLLTRVLPPTAVATARQRVADLAGRGAR